MNLTETTFQFIDVGSLFFAIDSGTVIYRFKRLRHDKAFCLDTNETFHMNWMFKVFI